jgi:DNA invertase Pin-like site-specific DNA recombinase
MAIYSYEDCIQLYPLFQPGTGERRFFPAAEREGRNLGEGQWLSDREELERSRHIQLPGENATKGDFGEFLRAAKAGELPKDSVLLVENLDRVSRQTPRKALSRFLDLIDIGIGVVTLTDGELYTAESLDEDASGMKLFGSLMVMIRANNESRVKGERVAAAWSRKRITAREKSLPLSDRIPGWLVSKRDEAGRRTFDEHDTKADIVRRIFAETAQGLGRRAIAKGLNREGTLSFLSESGWQPSSIIKIIQARTTVGEYQPHRRDDNGKRIPDGDPIKGYYPVVIDEALWVRANAAVVVRRGDGGGRPSTEVANLLRGLAHCSCGERMLFLNKGAPPKGGRYYVCSAAAREAKCDKKRLWNAKDVERYVLHQIDPASIAAALEPPTTPPSPRPFDRQIADLMRLKDAAIDAALRHAGKAAAADFERRIDAYNEQLEKLRRRREDAAAAERSRPHLPTTQSAISTIASLAAKLAGATSEERTALRTGIVQQLRTAFAEIVFGRHTIVGLIELPEKPKSLKGAFGLPRPIAVRMVDGVERYFLTQLFFRDDPEELAALGGGKGVVFPRFA